MRTIRIHVQVTEPKRTAQGLVVGLHVIEKDGIRLEGHETAAMNMNFPVGAEDVGLVLPVDVVIYRKGEEDPGPQPEVSRSVLAEARAELARKRAAGEVPPISPQARALLAEMRAILDRGDTKATIRVGHGWRGASRASTTIKRRP